MKSVGVIVFLLLVWNINGYGQSKTKDKQHFIELNQFLTGSGFGSSTELCVKLSNDDKKTIAIGTFFCYDTDKISGITLRHEIRIFRGKTIINGYMKPYVFYNMIYRRSSFTRLGDDSSLEIPPGRYTSMEHHLGIGSKMHFSKTMFISADLGFGTFLGSIMKAETLSQYSGEIAGTNGFGYLIKIGIGCNIF